MTRGAGGNRPEVGDVGSLRKHLTRQGQGTTVDLLQPVVSGLKSIIHSTRYFLDDDLSHARCVKNQRIPGP